MTPLALRRGGLVILMMLSTALLQVPGSSAQTAGTELVEALSAETNGPDASLQLLDVAVFPPSGEAVIDPGSSNEETLSYSSVDTEQNRLVGLERNEPTSHPAGTIVRVPQSDPSSTPDPPSSGASPEEPEPDPDETSSAEDAPGSETADSSAEAGSESSSERADAETPDPCFMVTGSTCTELVGETIDDVACVSALTCQLVRDLETGDPCDPDATGQSCVQYAEGEVQELEDFLVSAVGDPCDPNSTGQTCSERFCNMEEGQTRSTSIDEILALLTNCEDYAPYVAPATGTLPPTIAAIPVPDADDGKACFVFFEVTNVDYWKPPFSALIRQSGGSKISSTCSKEKVPWIRADVYIAHHAAGMTGTRSSSNSSQGAAPGPYSPYTYQSHSIFPTYFWGSLLEWRFTFGWEFKKTGTDSATWCYYALYGGEPHPAPCLIQ